MKKSKKHPIYNLKNPWSENPHAVWVASTLTLYRNLSNFSFPPKLDLHRQEQVVSLISEGVLNCPELKSPKLFKSKEIGPIEKEFLLEHFLALDGFHQAHGGEGFIIDETGKFLAVVNIGNHLQVELIDTTQEIEKAWGKLIKIENSLGKSVDYAYNSRFGFLTSNPAYSGTGLLIRLILHIPAIIHSGELAELLEKEYEEEILAVGIQGSSSEMIGDIIVAQNSCTTGVTEEYLLTSLRMWATKAVVAEVNARKKFKAEGNKAIKNKIARALGLLTHSYQLETIEALNALSLVKLGVELGWIQGGEKLNFNELFFNTRRAHLLNLLEEKVDIPDLPIKRADTLHQAMKDLVLVI